MNGRLYTQNLATIANFDGADAVAADGENRILVKWATVLTSENQGGKMDYRLWQIILVAKGGDYSSGSLYEIVLAVVEIITGESQLSGWTIPELVSLAADSGGGPIPPLSPILFRLKAGDRPAGSIFSRAGDAFQLSSLPPPSSSPRWYTVDDPQGIMFSLGDSITAGTMATESYFPKTQRQYASTKRLHNSNLSVPSAFISNSGSPDTNMTDIESSFVDPVFTSMKGVAVVFGGTNDMFLGGASGAVAFSRLQTLCAMIRASHVNVRIVVVTPLPRQNNGSFEVSRQAMRALMNGGDPSYDFVADWGGNATMAANEASSTNTTYYSDEIHPTDEGHIIGASIVGPAVQSALAASGL